MNSKIKQAYIKIICIYFMYRSTSTYTFLREQEILPLPCTRTIRTYLSLVRTQCGFDEKFFLLFKKKNDNTESSTKAWYAYI